MIFVSSMISGPCFSQEQPVDSFETLLGTKLGLSLTPQVLGSDNPFKLSKVLQHIEVFSDKGTLSHICISSWKPLSFLPRNTLVSVYIRSSSQATIHSRLRAAMALLFLLTDVPNLFSIIRFWSATLPTDPQICHVSTLHAWRKRKENTCNGRYITSSN